MVTVGPDAEFQHHLGDGKFMIQRSASTGRLVFPPRVMAPGEGAQDLEWIEASGRGSVHSFTVVGQKAPLSGYNICLVDLDEGPRLMTRLIDVDNDAIVIGMPVEVAVEAVGERPVLSFRPVKA